MRRADDQELRQLLTGLRRSRAQTPVREKRDLANSRPGHQQRNPAGGATADRIRATLRSAPNAAVREGRDRHLPLIPARFGPRTGERKVTVRRGACSEQKP